MYLIILHYILMSEQI